MIHTNLGKSIFLFLLPLFEFLLLLLLKTRLFYLVDLCTVRTLFRKLVLQVE